MRRRILAITLLIAFGFPLVAPLLAATTDPEASLPPCCRSNGKHHCAMMHLMLMASSGPSFNAPPCPFYPAGVNPQRVVPAALTPTVTLAVVQLRAPAPAAAAPRSAAGTFIAAANLKRGPPAFPA